MRESRPLSRAHALAKQRYITRHRTKAKHKVLPREGQPLQTLNHPEEVGLICGGPGRPPSLPHHSRGEAGTEAWCSQLLGSNCSAAGPGSQVEFIMLLPWDRTSFPCHFPPSHKQVHSATKTATWIF